MIRSNPIDLLYIYDPSIIDWNIEEHIDYKKEYIENRNSMLAPVWDQVRGFLSQDRQDVSSESCLWRAALVKLCFDWKLDGPTLTLLFTNRWKNRFFEFNYEIARITYRGSDRLGIAPDEHPYDVEVPFHHPADYSKLSIEAIGYENGEFRHEFFFGTGEMVVFSKSFQFREYEGEFQF